MRPWPPAHVTGNFVLIGGANVTQIVIDLVDFALSPEKAADVEPPPKKMILAALTFALGALGAVLPYLAVGFWCLLIPIMAIVAGPVVLRRL